MSRLMLLGIQCLLLLCATLACSRPPTNGEPATQTVTGPSPGKGIASVDVVTAMPQPVEIPAGGSAETRVRLTIQGGYHVNANPPTYSYLKATELEIPASDGVSVGFVVYPDPLKKKFSFAEQPLAVYEGEPSLRVLLKADPSAKKGERHLSGKLRIQACDDQVCYAPGTIDLTLPVKIK